MRSMNVRRSMIAALSVAVVAAGVVVPAYAADGDPMLAPDPSPSAEPTASPTPDPTSTPDSTPPPGLVDERGWGAVVRWVPSWWGMGCA